jgi:hypothetical protein
MNVTSNVELHTHALYAVKVWLKSVGNEGYFTLEAETVFRHYLAFHWSGMNKTSNIGLSALSAVEVSLKSVGKELYFIL